MREHLEKALKAGKGYTEIRVQSKSSTSVAFRSGEMDKIAASTDVGGCVRALVPNGGWGIAVFNSLDGLEERVAEAVASSAAIVPEEPINLAPVEPVEKEIRAEIENDPREHDISQKVELVKSYDSILRSMDSRMIDTNVAFGDGFSTTYFINTEGAFIKRERLDVTLRVAAVCKQGDNIQTAHDSWSSRSDFDIVLSKEKDIEKIGKIAIGLLEAEQVQAGRYTVILDPMLAGVFIHEAFGHLSESDHIVDNPQAREMMTLGRRFGPDFLDVFDDGSIKPELRGTITIDDEGVSCKRNYLIKNGILVGRLHNRETAAKMGEPLTGSARAQDYNFSPVIRMTNTAIGNGDKTFEQLVGDIGEGIYCIEAYGGQTMMENFSFSAGYAYMIRKGKIAELVRDVVLQGNLFETLMNIEAIGNDFRWSVSGGACGKGGQAAPVSFGSPHIRIKNVIIGGK